MILWCFKWIILSFILIILIHYLYIFFQNTLTTPKVKDLINKPTERYNEIISSINNTTNTINTTNTTNTTNTNNLNNNSMEFELKNFLKDLKQSNNTSTN